MLELKNVCKSYEGFAVKNISFTLPRGYIMG
ncbi:sodium ABC transporter ATP-binding protein, partial [Bacillus cereus]|nr:sodium ABC transporter ATP-binding protein [Bacillus cereus]